LDTSYNSGVSTRIKIIKVVRTMVKETRCPKCKSKNLSDGETDFVAINGVEELIQFCYDCHKEWFV